MTEPALFFGGRDRSLKTVVALPHLTFRQLSDQIYSTPIPLAFSRSEFHAMDKAERDRRKRVPYIVPAVFSATPSPRRTENALFCNLICVDIDDPVDAHPLVEAPWTVEERLMPYGFALHHTASSTPAAPRLRVIVYADAIPVERYVHAVEHIAALLGIRVNKESKVAVQPMYLPVQFQGDVDKEHPLVCGSPDGRAFKNNEIRKVDHTENPLPDKLRPSDQPVEGLTSAIDFLRPPVETITQENVAEMLTYMDSDLVYHEWLEVAAAMRHQFPHDHTGEAFELFNEWSSTGEKYKGRDDCLAKWQSFRPNPVNRVPITIRSLMRKAELSGWNPAVVRQDAFFATRKWILDAARDPISLISEGLGRIAATPLVTPAGEEALLNMLIEELRKRHGVRVSIGSIRKDLALVRADLRSKEAAQADSHRKRPGWTKGVVYVAAPDEFYRHATKEKWSPSALDRQFSAKLMTEMAGPVDPAAPPKSRPTAKPQDYLLNMLEIPRVYDYCYDPRCPDDTFLRDPDGRPMINLYIRNWPSPDHDASVKCGALLLGHLEKLIAEPEHRTTLLDWMAMHVQHPGRKVRWAVLLQGVEGCGKTILAEIMKAVLGSGNVRVVDNNSVGSGWNDWAIGSQLVAFEEVRVAGRNRHEVMNSLKPLITNEVINVNQRFRDSRQVENLTNYILFSNYHDCLALARGDRRYFVLKSTMQTLEQVSELGAEWFTRIFNALHATPGGFRAFLEDWPISADFNPDGHAPRTSYRDDMIDDGQHDSALAVKDSIELAPHPLISPELVASDVLLEWLELHGKLPDKMSARFLGLILRELGFYRSGRVQFAATRHTIWIKAGSSLDTPGLDPSVLVHAAYEMAGDLFLLD